MAIAIESLLIAIELLVAVVREEVTVLLLLTFKKQERVHHEHPNQCSKDKMLANTTGVVSTGTPSPGTELILSVLGLHRQ